MMSYALLSKKPKIFRTFTGLSIEEFNRLYPMIADRYEDYKKRDSAEKIGKRR